MSIAKLVQNQGKTEHECLGVLGDLNGLYAIAQIWETYPDLLNIIGIHELMEWTSKDFDSKELAAFKEGLAAFPKFFEKCFNEKKIHQSS